MATARANIEDATCTSMPVQDSGLKESGEKDDAAGSVELGGCVEDGGPSFLCSAFNTHIKPFERGEKSLAVAIALKAAIGESSIPVLANSLHRTFPQLVCTVTVGGTANEEGLREPFAPAPKARLNGALTGAIRLFGKDQSGQLAMISEVLHHHRATILNVFVTTGFADTETCEFLERPGGNISENFVAFAFFEKEHHADAAKLREEVERLAPTVGYSVHAVILDHQENRAQELASYYLRRKAFLAKQGSMEKKATSEECS